MNTKDLYYDATNGFLENPPSYVNTGPGLYHRQRSGKWRQRVKRHGSGSKWKRVREVPNHLKTLGLLLGIVV